MVEERVINVNGHEYPIKIFFEHRNYSRASITSNGIYIRIPRFMLPSKRESEIDRLVSWVKHKIESDASNHVRRIVYENGSYIRTTHTIYQLHLESRDSEKNHSKINGNVITIKVSKKYDVDARQKYISKRLQKILTKRHLPELIKRVHYLNDTYFKQSLGKITYKYTTSRWGACKINTREINISSRLILAPQEVLDYVIIHELAHLIETNHSEKYWRIVKSVDPSYKEKLTWLKVNRNNLKI